MHILDHVLLPLAESIPLLPSGKVSQSVAVVPAHMAGRTLLLVQSLAVAYGCPRVLPFEWFVHGKNQRTRWVLKLAQVCLRGLWSHVTLAVDV